MGFFAEANQGNEADRLFITKYTKHTKEKPDYLTARNAKISEEAGDFNHRFTRTAATGVSTAGGRRWDNRTKSYGPCWRRKKAELSDMGRETE